jgi:hypothetical protein
MYDMYLADMLAQTTCVQLHAPLHNRGANLFIAGWATSAGHQAMTVCCQGVQPNQE